MKKENWEWVDINLIKTDGNNPNVMNKAGKEALKKNITKFGFNMPIITDMNYLIADGEQKLTVAKEMGIKEVPILRKELTDTQRRIIRQSMNKIKGSHDNDLDALEFKKILEDTDMEELSKLIGSEEQEILNIIERNEKEISDTENVKKLGHLEVTCPKCKHTFKRGETE